MPNDGYQWDHTADPGREQLMLLAEILDRPTTGFLETVDIRRSWRCLDVGAGGRLNHSLARRTNGRDRHCRCGRPLPDHLRVPQSVEVYQHDIHDGLPTNGGFDLIHARLVLANLPRREEIFKALVDALSPGGWLVLAEGTVRPQTVLASPGRAEEELFHRVLDAALAIAAAAGYSWPWADSVGERMADAGLVNVDSSEYGYQRPVIAPRPTVG